MHQLRDGGVDVLLLAVEQGDARLALGDGDAELFLMLLVGVVEVDHLTNVGQAESHPLAAQYPGQAGAGRGADIIRTGTRHRSEEHTSELQSLMRTSYAVFCLKQTKSSHAHTSEP